MPEQVRQSETSRLDVAAKAVAVELGFCDPNEWGTEEMNSDDRDCAYRAAGAALDAADRDARLRAIERDRRAQVKS